MRADVDDMLGVDLRSPQCGNVCEQAAGPSPPRPGLSKRAPPTELAPFVCGCRLRTLRACLRILIWIGILSALPG